MLENQSNKCCYCDRTDTNLMSARLLGGMYGIVAVCQDHNPYRAVPTKKDGIFHLKKRHYDAKRGIFYDKRRTKQKTSSETQQKNEEEIPSNNKRPKISS